MSGKRHFPYHSAVPEIELKRPALAAAAPGRERAQPRVFQEGLGFGAVREEVCRSACRSAYISVFPPVCSSFGWRLRWQSGGVLLAGPCHRLHRVD